MDSIQETDQDSPETTKERLNEFARRVVDGRKTADLFGLDDSAVNSLLHQAHTLYVNKRFSEARVLAEGVVALDETHPYAHLLLGDICLQLKDVDEAVAHLQRAHELDPTSAGARVKLGEALLRVERTAEAVATLEGAVKALQVGTMHRKRAVALLMVAASKIKE